MGSSFEGSLGTGWTMTGAPLGIPLLADDFNGGHTERLMRAHG